MEVHQLSVQSLRAWCARHEVPCDYLPEREALSIPKPGAPDVAVRVVERPEVGLLTLAMVLPFKVPPERLEEVAKAVNRLNDSLAAGAWLLHLDTFEVLYRLGVPTRGVSYDDHGVAEVIKMVIGTAEASADRLRAVAVQGAPFTSVR